MIVFEHCFVSGWTKTRTEHGGTISCCEHLVKAMSSIRKKEFHGEAMGKDGKSFWCFVAFEYVGVLSKSIHV